jgi:drug/metabolite transporter (DMT)-like permease
MATVYASGPQKARRLTNIRTDVDAETMPPAAIGLAFGTFAMFAFMDTAAKFLVTAGLASVFVVWCRFASQGVIVFFTSRAWSNRDVWRMQNVVLQVLRGLSLPLMTLLNFKALETLQLAETVTVFLTAPMMVTALAGPLLGEWAGRRRWAAIGVGFLGVLLVARPGTAMFSGAILFSIAATVVYSLYSIMTRKLAQTESQESLVFYSCFFGILIIAPFAYVQASTPPTWLHLVLLCSFGGFGMAGHIMLIKASRIATASKVAPFVYSQLLWMTLLGFIVFGDFPDLWTIAGALVICASGLYLMNRERVLHNERKSMEQLK